MYLQRSRPPLATREITKQEDESDSCCTLRCWLLLWGSLRLVVTVLWISILITSTIGILLSENHQIPPIRLWFKVISILVQLVEFVMIVTFITAGVKESVSLYRAYYYYCILTLSIFITALILCFIVQFEGRIDLAEMYLTYNINDIVAVTDKQAMIFVISAVLDICVEVLVIVLIKKLINKYNYRNFTSV